MSVGVNVRMSKIMCIPTKVDVCTYATYVNSQALTKLDKRNTTTSRFDLMPFWQIVTSLSFFQFMTNLQPSKSCILDAWPTQLSYYCFD